MRTLTLTLLILFSSLIFAEPDARFVYHTVEKGETLYSISKQYGLKPQDLTQYNAAIGGKLTIHIGQKLKIPTANTGAENPGKPEETGSASDQSPKQASGHPDAYHIVRKGETVYSIAKLHEVQRADLIAWNNLKDNNLEVGRKLVIKTDGSTAVTNTAENTTTASSGTSYSKKDIEKAIKKDGYTWTLPSDPAKTSKTNVSTASSDVTASATPVGLADSRVVKSWKTESTSDRVDYFSAKTATPYDPAAEYESLYYQSIYSGMTKKSEAGVAKFLTDNNNANIAYYNNASIGTILKLTNPDNGKVTYAIVVGKLPETEENSYLLKLSNKVAKNLSAKDYSSVEIVCYLGP